MTDEVWAETDKESVGACPICEATERHALHENLQDRVFHCAPGEWTLYRCAQCQGAYLDPRPTPETIHRAYATYYTHQTDSAKSGLSRLLKIGNIAVRNSYLNAAFGYNFRPALPLTNWLLPGRRRAEASRWIRHLQYPISKTSALPRLLDVGCGNGSFVAQMQAVGWDAHGLDVDAQAVTSAQVAGRTTVRQGALEPDTYAPESFDAVTMSHVIEHLHDPAETVRNCWRVLRPGGKLWIATPNLHSLGHDRWASDWLALDPPRHLVLFTPDSLRGLLERARFVDIAGPLPNWSARWSFRSSAAIAHGANDPLSAHDIRSAVPRTELSRITQEAKEANLRALTQPELAEEVILLATKPEAG